MANTQKPNKTAMRQAPEPLRSFLIYIENIQGKSVNTANEYFYDIRNFYRFLKLRNSDSLFDENFDKTQIDDVNVDFLKAVDLNTVYEYMNFLSNVKNNTPRSRARKISSLRSYFKYLHSKADILAENPLAELENIKIGKTLPKYFTLEDSLALLKGIEGEHAERDYCMFTLFLNCGMRLAELVGINITDIRGDRLTVVGKGNKERTVYLNRACLDAIEQYLPVRNTMPVTAADKNALFVSRNGRRITRRRVQQIVEENVKKIGLDPHKFTTHKLRHTAATLMYQAGVDIRALQEILGHEQLSTTEIYTHTNNEQLREAVDANPLSRVQKEKL